MNQLRPLSDVACDLESLARAARKHHFREATQAYEYAARLVRQWIVDAREWETENGESLHLDEPSVKVLIAE